MTQPRRETLQEVPYFIIFTVERHTCGDLPRERPARTRRDVSATGSNRSDHGDIEDSGCSMLPYRSVDQCRACSRNVWSGGRLAAERLRRRGRPRSTERSARFAYESGKKERVRKRERQRYAASRAKR